MNNTNLETDIRINWKEELMKTASRYHYVGAWVAAIFNPIFGATDYINVRDHFENFMTVRLAASAITLIVLVLRKPLKIRTDFLIFVPFLLISIQNAYMWSFMDAAEMQKHTLVYIALFIGAGMLILWKMRWSITVVVLSIAANIFFLTKNSHLSLEEIMVSGGLLTGTVMIFSILLIQTRYNLSKREIIARLALEKSNKLLHDQKLIIEQKNEDITASLRYAKRIQDSILPPQKSINKHLKDAFILFKPRDIVSGDFYWFRHKGNKFYIAAVDCTGHGVPGAFMSMIGNTLLNKLATEHRTPAEILNEMRREIIQELSTNEEEMKTDGMDLALCAIDLEKLTLDYAGAYNPLYQIRAGELHETKADRMPIGHHFGKMTNFTNHQLKIEPDDVFYIFSDGFSDQIGNTGVKKYSTRKLKKLLTDIYTLPFDKQKEFLETEMKNWMGKEKQLDDMLVIGFKI